MPLSEKLLLSVNEASKFSGLNVNVIRLEVEKGSVDYIVTGKQHKVLINRKSLERLIDEMSRIHTKISPATARQDYNELKSAKGA